MARPDPTHRELSSGRPVHAEQWHAPGDRPEGPPDCFEVKPYFRLTAPIPAPLVRTFSTALIGQRADVSTSDKRSHAEASADAFVRNCTTLLCEHGWLPHPSGEPGTGWLLCPGDWVITYEDGTYRSEADHWFAERYQPL